MATAITPTGVTFSDSTIQTTAAPAPGGFSTRTSAFFYGGGINQSPNYYSQLFTTFNQNGVMSVDSTFVNAAQTFATGAMYGQGNGLVYGGYVGATTTVDVTNISPSGAISASTTYAFPGRWGGSSVPYGGTNSVIYLGQLYPGGATNTSLLIGGLGIPVSSQAAIGTARQSPGNGFGFGAGVGMFLGGSANVYNLVSNVGVIAADVSAGFGSLGFDEPIGATYGTDKGVAWQFGSSFKNVYFVSNVGVISRVTALAAAAVRGASGATYGNDKAVFAFGDNGSTVFYNTTHLVSNIGTQVAETSTLATARSYAAASSIGN